jgi:hypothetical protein
MYWQHFPEWCSSYWVLRLFADLKRKVMPLENKAVEAICRNLRHDRFTVREKATADAMKTADRIVPALRKHLKEHPSPELEHRIGLIAEHFKKQPVPPIAARVIDSAMYGGEFQGELIFEALSGPAGSCRLADCVRDKRPEQLKRRQEVLKQRIEANRLQQPK